MRKPPSKLTAIVVATASAGLSGAALAAAADSGSSPSATTTQNAQQQPPPRDGRGHRGGMHADLAAVAKDLGVTEEKLRSAVEAARPEKPNGDRSGQRPEPGERPTAEQRAAHEKRRAAMYAAVATSLGKSADEVEKAFEANKP